MNRDWLSLLAEFLHYFRKKLLKVFDVSRAVLEVMDILMQNPELQK